VSKQTKHTLGQKLGILAVAGLLLPLYFAAFGLSVLSVALEAGWLMGRKTADNWMSYVTEGPKK
jgi:hypothetical protein